MPRDEQCRRRTKKAKKIRNNELFGKYNAKAVRTFENKTKTSVPPSEETTSTKNSKLQNKGSKKLVNKKK